jgi:hypothetical protein
MTLKLAVPMTQEKEMEIHREISKVIKDIAGIEEQKKRLPSLKARMNELNLSIDAQTVEADVDCEEFEDIETGLIKMRRLDTGMIFKTRPMDPEERQLKIGGTSIDDVNQRLAELNTTEEQATAATPEEAEQLRDSRLAEEKATRAFDALVIGDGIELFDGTEWKPATVEAKAEHNFTVGEHIYDVSNHGVSWRPAATWQDVVAESQERERQSQIAALAADQAEDEQETAKRLLKAPPRKPRNKIVNEKDEPIVPPEETAPPAAEAQPEEIPPADLCLEDCAIEHEHTETRTAF